MSLITKEEAHKNLEPFYELFNKSCHEAWNYWLTGGAPRMQNSRYRACALWNDFLYSIRKEIDSNNYPNICYAKIKYFQGLLVNDKYFIRFKKGDKSFRTSNYPTQSALNYHDPEIDMFGGIVRLELIYLLNDDGVGINKVLLTQSKGKTTVWAIDITNLNITPSNIESEHHYVDNNASNTVIKPKTDIAKKHKVVNDKANE